MLRLANLTASVDASDLLFYALRLASLAASVDVIDYALCDPAAGKPYCFSCHQWDVVSTYHGLRASLLQLTPVIVCYVRCCLQASLLQLTIVTFSPVCCGSQASRSRQRIMTTAGGSVALCGIDTPETPYMHPQARRQIVSIWCCSWALLGV